MDFLKTGIRDLTLRKSRSALTMLGIIIGVASVISVMAVGAGAKHLLISQISSMGSNLIAVLPGAGGPPSGIFGIEITTLNTDDSKAISEIPHIVGVASYTRGSGTATYFNKTKSYDYIGVSSSYTKVEDTEVGSGRFFRKDEETSLTRKAVLGYGVAEYLFGISNPIGEKIKINQVSFEVTGVMKKRGTAMFQNQDDQIFLPLKTAQKILLGIDHLSFLRIKVDESENMPFVKSRVEETLRFNHNIKDPAKDDFSVRSTKQALDILGDITQAIEIFLVLVVGISLLVGGVGIMNIMFVSVNERTREIGLRKAIGARKRDILTQFLIESTLLTFIGGIFGIILGILISFLISFGVNKFGYDWQLIISPISIVISMIMAIFVGVVFGMWPAYNASKMDPIIALRYE